jgi:hypothetical protein
MSPFDINPDDFSIQLTIKNSEKLKLLIPQNFTEYLPQMVSFIEKKGINIIDKNHLISAILNEKNLYDYMHEKTSK